MGQNDIINTANIFAALDNRGKKSSKKDKKKKEEAKTKEAEKPSQFWAPAPVAAKSWADIEDDDDDYYATTAPPPPVWGAVNPVNSAINHDELNQTEESEGEDDVFEEVEDDAEKEQENEGGADAVSDLNAKSSIIAPTVVSKEPERQLSKKELKKKELDELDAVLQELGLGSKELKDTIGSGTEGKTESTKEDINRDVDNKGGPTLEKNKSSKRRKAKKEKPFKESKDGADQIKDEEKEQPADASSMGKEEENQEEDGASVDPKERLRKLASFKKKKSSKEHDAAAKAAAAEAAVRAAKLANAKKKEKNHYNQQPAR